MPDQLKQFFILKRYRLIRLSRPHLDLLFHKDGSAPAGDHIHVDVRAVFLPVHILLYHQVVIQVKQHLDLFRAAHLIDVQTGAAPHRLHKDRIGNLPALHRPVECLLVQITFPGRDLHLLQKLIHPVFIKTGLHQIIIRYDRRRSHCQKLLPLLRQQTEFRVDQ